MALFNVHWFSLEIEKTKTLNKFIWEMFIIHTIDVSFEGFFW